MFVYRTHGVVAAGVALLLAAGCTADPERSDLRTGVVPGTLAVLVNAPDPRGNPGNLENATFCKLNDDKRPGIVGLIDTSTYVVCPLDLTQPATEVTNADPTLWYVRVMFDELLDPSVEDLITNIDPTTMMPDGTYTGTLANTQPVTLQCKDAAGTLQDVPYDGYYSPSGNALTNPLGPSLYIQALNPTSVPTQSECQISIKAGAVKSKEEKVLTGADMGPFKFQLNSLQVVALAPADGGMVDAIAAGADLTFNAPIDPTSIDPTLAAGVFTFTPTEPNQFLSAEAPNEVFLGQDFKVSTAYEFAIVQGAQIKDACGVVTTFGAPDVALNTMAGFMTNDLLLNGITPSDGTMNSAPSDGLALNFNQYMDNTTLDPGNFTMVPAPKAATCAGCDTAVQVSADFAGNIIIDGVYALNTSYVFTLNAGATIQDCPGGEFGGCANNATFTNTSVMTVSFKTAAAINLASTSPADNDMVTGSAQSITLTFNQKMDPNTLTAADYTISPAVALTTCSTFNTGDPTTDCPSENALTLSGTFPPGTYTFTLKGTGSISDQYTPANVFTPGTDQVIHFTVQAAPPPVPCLP